MAILVAVMGTLACDQGVGVQTVKAAREDIQSKVSANGKIQAVKKVDISANVMGQVTRLALKEGDRVKAGDFLLEIDPVRSRAAVAGLEAALQASGEDLATQRARLEQAQSDFRRAEANVKAGIIARADFEQVRTALATARTTAQAAQKRVDQARSDLAQAQDVLSKSRLTSPIDGVVTAKRIEQGETAVIGVQNQPGTVLLTISDMSRVEAEMEVDEASIPNVKVGQTAQVRIDAYANQVFKATVTEVGGSPILKAANEAIKFKVKVQIQDPPATIKPGLSTQADIFTGRRDQVLAIPIQALVMKEIPLKPGEKRDPAAPREEEGVFLMEGGKARFQAVKTGLMGELNVEVLSGLKEGDVVVNGPLKALRELKGGERIRVEAKGRKPEAK